MSAGELLVSSSTSNGHDGGNVDVDARRIIISGNASGIETFAQPGSSGDAGRIIVSANEITISGGAISSGAREPLSSI